MAEGLGSLQGGRHLWWVAWHSVADLDGARRRALPGRDARARHRPRLARAHVSAAFVTLTAVGIAVALPSAPGFLGPYHLAAREALRRFGVTEELALALGTLSHAVFWVTTTGIGLAVLRFRGTRLDELADAASADADQVPSSAPPITDRECRTFADPQRSAPRSPEDGGFGARPARVRAREAAGEGTR